MRTLGPGSVSSFLKVILDVVYFALLFAAAALALAVVVVLLVSFRPELWSHAINIDGQRLQGPWAGPAIAGEVEETS